MSLVRVSGRTPGVGEGEKLAAWLTATGPPLCFQKEQTVSSRKRGSQRVVWSKMKLRPYWRKSVQFDKKSHSHLSDSYTSAHLPVHTVSPSGFFSEVWPHKVSERQCQNLNLSSQCLKSGLIHDVILVGRSQFSSQNPLSSLLTSESHSVALLLQLVHLFWSFFLCNLQIQTHIHAFWCNFCGTNIYLHPLPLCSRNYFPQREVANIPLCSPNTHVLFLCFFLVFFNAFCCFFCQPPPHRGLILLTHLQICVFSLFRACFIYENA